MVCGISCVNADDTPIDYPGLSSWIPLTHKLTMTSAPSQPVWSRMGSAELYTGRFVRAMAATMAGFLRTPVRSILIPCILMLTLAYPSIYVFSVAPWSVYNLYLGNDHLFKRVRVSYTDNDQHRDNDLSITSISIHSQDGVLTKDCLIELHDLQDQLTHALIGYPVRLYSPLEYWDNDITSLKADNNIMKTTELNGGKKPFDIQTLNSMNLLGGIQKVDGLTKSADTLRIVLIHKAQDMVVDDVLLETVEFFIERYPQYSIFKSSSQDMSSTVRLRVEAQRSSLLESFLIYAFFPVLLITCMFKLHRSKFLCCKPGIFVGGIFQMSLSILASLSVISILGNQLDFLQVPFTLYLAIPALVMLQNEISMISAAKIYLTEISPLKRGQKMIQHTLPSSTMYNIVALVVIFIAGWITRTSASVHFCAFTMLCLFFNYFLTYTYFFTILTVDLNKVELQDLLNVNDDDMDSTSDDNEGMHLSIEELHELNHLKVKETPSSPFIILSLGNITFNAALSLLFLRIALQWTDGIDMRIPDSVEVGILDLFSNKRGFVHELIKISDMRLPLVLELASPIILSSLSLIELDSFSTIAFERIITYTFDIFYFFEYISFLIFTASSLMIILRFAISKSLAVKSSNKFAINNGNSLSHSNNNGSSIIPSFQCRDLCHGHYLDIVKLCTSMCPFIVSVGMDQKLLVWSPMKEPMPKPTQLPIPTSFLPITNTVMADSGSFITVFSRSGEVKCWSRLSMSWVWSIQLEELVNGVPLESFFRRRTHVSNGRRKLVSRGARGKVTKADPATAPEVAKQLPPSTTTSTTSSSEPLRSTKPVKETNVHTKTVRLRSRARAAEENVAAPVRSMSIDSSFDQSVNVNKLTYNSDMEFIIILRNGCIYVVDCTDGSMEKSILSPTPILCAKRLVSPRVNDRIVGIKENGELVLATAVNNKWKSRPVKVDTSNYNMGKSLITPAVLSRYNEYNYPATAANPNMFTTLQQQTGQATKKVEFNVDSMIDFDDLVMETVPFVGMIVRAFGVQCQLIDVQTGIALKEWEIEKFKHNSFSVFHPEPSHCRFCGCASVASFSIAYTQLDTNTLMLHTFSIDNRAKNNICLRVERDARETRCLGFASVSEHRHTLENVEGWCSTEMNMLIGVRKKEHPEEEVVGETGKTSSGSMLNKILENGDVGIRKRNRKQSLLDYIGTLGSASPVGGDGDGNAVTGIKNSVDRSANLPHKISDLWEGWTMSADGNMRQYAIPDGEDSGLLIKKLGPVRKFGHKSIVVSFGNIMKVLYLGNDTLVEEEEYGDEHSSSSQGQSSSSLGFINRRRKLRIEKYDATHSSTTATEGSPVMEGEVEIAGSISTSY